MRVYPRFLAKTLIDEYKSTLAPPGPLFARYRDLKKRGLSQNDAFQTAGYENEFELTPQGMSDLKRLSDLANTQDVFLICQCGRNEYCHVDLLILLAEKHFGAVIEKLPFPYAAFRARTDT
jgi:hypothetical protein